MNNRGVTSYSVLILVVAVLFFIGLSIMQSDAQSSATAVVAGHFNVSASIGFTMSTNLTTGILFGYVNQSVRFNNGSANYNNNETGLFNRSNYIIYMSATNTVSTDTCIWANSNLTQTGGSNVIPLNNYTYAANASRFGGNMNVPGSRVLINATSSRFGTINLGAGINQSMQFWLDIPAIQSAGDYNNTVNFRIVQTGAACV